MAISPGARKPLGMNASLEQHLHAARQELTELDEYRAQLIDRITALEVAAGLKPMPPLVQSSYRDAVAPPAQRRTAPRAAERAPSGSWKSAVQLALTKGKGKFTYDELLAAAKEVGMSDTPKASVRVRVSKFKSQELLAGEDGVYHATAEGKKFFAS